MSFVSSTRVPVFALLMFWVLCALPAAAHDYWLKPNATGAELVYGHAAESEAYEKTVLKEFQAVNSAGARVGQATFSDGTYKLKVVGAKAYLATVDDGPWVKTIRGWKRGTKKQHGRVLQSTQDYYYAKLVRGSDKSFGLPLEIVLLRQPTANKVVGKVFFRGKAAAKVPIEINHKKVARTNSDGTFELTGPQKSPLILRAAYKEKLKDSSEIDASTHVVTLTYLP